jgi:alanine dehydrogenase
VRIGIPTEIKPKEGRVALIAAAAAELVRAQLEVRPQSGAGILAGYSDDDFEAFGYINDAPDANIAGFIRVADAMLVYGVV